MKKILFVLPLATLFLTSSAQQSSTTNSGTSAKSTTTNSRFGGYDINKYDPNNYMQNPEKYKSPRELIKTGGWTYNTEWNQMTNFLADALGQWMLMPTEEVAAFWIPDSSRAETYAAYWAPEAVAARQQAKMMAAAAYNDSVAMAQGYSQATASIKKGKASGLRTQTSVNSGSGSTGEMGSGGVSTSGNNSMENASADITNNGMTSPQTASNTKNYLMAVNGNMFAMPRLNLYLQNGTFTGYTGSNELVGTLKVDGTMLKFDETIPSTNMSAMGGFSQSAFMERLGRVNSYDVTDGQLRLKQDNEVLFVLGKNIQP